MAFIHDIDLEADELIVAVNKYQVGEPYAFTLRNRGQWLNAGMIIPPQMELSRAIRLGREYAQKHRLLLTVIGRCNALTLWDSYTSH